MTRHPQIAAALGVIEIFFCDPHSPWQRPSNGNTNGLLRDYAFPVPRLDALEHRCRALGDEGHARHRTRASGLGVPAGEPLAAAMVEDPPGQLSGQPAEVGAMDGLMDRLGAEPAKGLVGADPAQLAADRREERPMRTAISRIVRRSRRRSARRTRSSSEK